MSLTLILGGARSGKSAHAEHLGRTRVKDGVVYVATAEPRDAEMKERIAQHRKARPLTWRTIEVPRNVTAALDQEASAPSLVIVDCLTLLVSNILEHTERKRQSFRIAQNSVDLEIDAILRWQRNSTAGMIVVSNEVGMGLVPDTPLGRVYRDLLGRANARIASVSDEVVLMVAGIPMLVRATQR